jgi:hypothetical protein
MAVIGAKAKQEVFNKLQEVFPDTFWATDKEFRICVQEDGKEVQLKVALTASKENIAHKQAAASTKPVEVSPQSVKVLVAQPSEEEIETLRVMMEKLGM